MKIKIAAFALVWIFLLSCSQKEPVQKEETESTLPIEKSQTSSVEETAYKEDNKISIQPTPPLPAKPVPQSQKLNLPDPCGTNAESLQFTLMQVTAPLIGTKYNSKELTDCSGMFHRVLEGLEQGCPSFDYPSHTVYRDTRQLARFYHEKEALILIKDAVEQSDLLQPGAVLFFGYRGKEYDNFTADDLFNRGTGINHMGIVIEVTKDEEGVSSYTLFHGLRPGKPAAITAYHVRQPSKKTYPPFGNGKEQWVAIAPVVLVK